jgi:hypothetical protein
MAAYSAEKARAPFCDARLRHGSGASEETATKVAASDGLGYSDNVAAAPASLCNLTPLIPQTPFTNAGGSQLCKYGIQFFIRPQLNGFLCDIIGNGGRRPKDPICTVHNLKVRALLAG